MKKVAKMNSSSFISLTRPVSHLINSNVHVLLFETKDRIKEMHSSQSRYVLVQWIHHIRIYYKGL